MAAIEPKKKGLVGGVVSRIQETKAGSEAFIWGKTSRKDELRSCEKNGLKCADIWLDHIELSIKFYKVGG